MKEKKSQLLKSLLRIVLKVFLLVSMISMPVILHAQITVKADNETVRSILKKIEKQSDMTFFYNEALTDLNKKVSVNVKNSSLESTLNQVLKTTGLAFSFQGKTCILWIRFAFAMNEDPSLLRNLSDTF